MWRRALLLCLLGAPARAAELEVDFLDVGQGDATLLVHAGKAVLIDTGPVDAIVEQLHRHGVRELELLVISHNHADHLGGADAVLAEMPVHAFLDNDYPSKTKIQETVLRLVEAHGVKLLPASAPEVRLDDLVLHVLPPPAEVEGDEQNNHSVGLLVEHGTFRALLTGDSEVEEINVWLAAARIPDVDVLKAAHHGSRNGVTPGWLIAAKPELVVISCGAGNDYGHPHAAALRYYEAGGRRVVRTDIDGELDLRVTTAGTFTATASRTGVVKVPAPVVVAPVAPSVVTKLAVEPIAPAVVVKPAAAEAAPVAAKPADQATATKPKPAEATTTHSTLPLTESTCCRVCRTSKPCGDSCISIAHNCSKPPGCACAAPPAQP